MSLEQRLSAAWRNNSKWLYLLTPLSALYGLITAAHRWLYRIGLKSAYRPSVPTVVIGNITVGGSGKTPLVLALIKHLSARGVRVGVISRGYRADSAARPLLIDASSRAEQVGDEPLLIARSGAVVCVSPNRKAAIDHLTQNHQLDLILSDDGLQHYALEAHANWVIVDTQRGFGRGWLLPAGFLREPPRLLSRCDLTIHRTELPGGDLQITTDRLYQLSDPSKPIDVASLNAAHPKGGLAVAGIAQPERFFHSLSELGLIHQTRVFNDHHTYRADQLKTTKPYVVTTEKDAVKLKPEWFEVPIYVLAIEAQLSEALQQRIHSELNRIGVKLSNSSSSTDSPNAQQTKSSPEI